ncbi:UDP-N-acetylmuramoyl-tripeptide--D-alanyl-D-alanine ligase [Flavobacterium sp.]|uniref:UDP-N-acetylmuramoyl-tripeptide--D-alanyl-D- alanine ligase n=1 Tax=Flavobacterium sp. TaxID=239 RepID=UPI00262A9D9E|nr:UDP-N-acetylmuramoyl-tripeptide--D-alanyl-D-alanine ligase [Flavobacterium sp.]MDD3003471.1 UDP-N-acetylmuramoyl-tripeptide--D-alanyl-D-alanine ligase [Flavobacterium sp.]
MDISTLHKIYLSCSSITTDSRKISEDSLFFALKGENFDANTFAKEALQKGAKYVVIDDSKYHINEQTILVDNTLKALQKLAQFHRNYLKLPVIALTGSNGKTTTKELIHAVLSQKFNVKATIGNLNNHIGVPLTLLSFNKSTEIGIVEMGANHQEEIAFLCEITQPDYGYITNFGRAHLEGFGGIEGVIKGKSEMYDYLLNNNKKVFINLDDHLQTKKSELISRFSFSSQDKSANVFINEIKADPYVSVKHENEIIQSNLIGIYNAPNINAAITIGKFFEVSNHLIKNAIENYFPTNNRSQLSRKGSNELILDAYNANPSSMKAALQNLIELPQTNKIAFLGDMFELGDESYNEHTAIVESMKNQPEIEFYFVGKEFYKTKTTHPNFHFFSTFEELKMELTEKKFENKYILIKGSRGMALERIVELL